MWYSAQRLIYDNLHLRGVFTEDKLLFIVYYVLLQLLHSIPRLSRYKEELFDYSLLLQLLYYLQLPLVSVKAYQVSLCKDVKDLW